jgi:hypothetical protein
MCDIQRRTIETLVSFGFGWLHAADGIRTTSLRSSERESLWFHEL